MNRRYIKILDAREDYLQ